MKWFELNPIFSDNMVFQRNKELRIFGKSQEGVIIDVNIKIYLKDEFVIELKESTKVTGDLWEVFFPPPTTFLGKYGSELMNIKFHINLGCQDQIYSIQECVFGEVYIAGGQSNMQYPLSECLEFREAKNFRDKMDFRYYFAPRIAYTGEDKSEEVSGWYKAEDNVFDQFSAVAFFFAQKISEYIDCPIGIIGCNWGGSSLFSWISEEQAFSIKETEEYVADIVNTIKGKSESRYNQECRSYEAEIKLYEVRVQELLSEDENMTKENPLIRYYRTRHISYPWPPPMGVRSFLRPGALYEHMLKPLAPYSIAGVLWYQGESDVILGDSYGVMLRTLFDSWRSLFEDQKLPFLVVQLPIFLSNAKENKGRVLLRQAQENACREDENAHLACALDLGERDNIHPFKKREVGIRLGFLAGKYIYNLNIVSEGPKFRQLVDESDCYRITFDNADQGIYGEYGMVIGFKIVEDKDTYPVSGYIHGRDILIPKNEIRHESQVQNIEYGYESMTMASIKNWKGLPLYPFSIKVSGK